MKGKKLPSEKGYELEAKIEKYFQLHGYETKRNVVLEGKSGGKHEIDILAEKSNGITTIRLMVECKAWNKPIEKDVVSKVNYVLRDVGLDKAIIVSLKGWRIGAEKSAEELGIELWGSHELEKKLGKVALAELEAFEFKKTTLTFPLTIREEDAKSLIEKEIKGFLKFGAEEIVSMILIWLPCYLFQIAHSTQVGIIRRKIISRTIWNIYDAMEGNFFASCPDEPKLSESIVDKLLHPRIKDETIVRNLMKILEKRRSVTTYKAVDKYSSMLEALGIPLPVANISVEKITETHYPFYIALLRKGEEQRIIAVDGVNGNLHKIISDVLTRNLSYLLESIRKSQ